MPRYDTSARKRPVNLTLNADLVARAGVEREERRHALATTVAAWNAHAEAHGSLADEYSPL